jgi:hypothetical protein
MENHLPLWDHSDSSQAPAVIVEETDQFYIDIETDLDVSRRGGQHGMG